MNGSERAEGTKNLARQRVGARGVQLIVSAAAVCSSLSGCGSSESVKTEVPMPPVATEAPSPTAADESAAILAAYRQFFARQAEISAAPTDQRKALLAPFTADPELDRVLRGMFAAEGFGEVGYGAPVVHPRVTQVDGGEATVNDCQDTSAVGQKKRSTGKVTQHGVKAAKVVAKLVRGADGSWRVSYVDYPDQPC